MNDQSQTCPKCGAELTELKGGLKCCPSCGFEGEATKKNPNATCGWSRILFWAALVTPAMMALASFLVGRISSNLRDTGAGIGFAALLVGAVASIYCGVWLARRFCEQPGTRLALGIFSTLAIAVVNFILIFAGCAGNLSFH